MSHTRMGAAAPLAASATGVNHEPGGGVGPLGGRGVWAPKQMWTGGDAIINVCPPKFVPVMCISGTCGILLHCALRLAAQCIVIGHVCGFVCLCVFVCAGMLPR